MTTRLAPVVFSLLATLPALAQAPADAAERERARQNFARPIVLAPDDVRAFPDAPAGYKARRGDGPAGRIGASTVGVNATSP